MAGGTRASVAFSFIFCMGYLVLGYYHTATKDYDITWTMPHCILSLRLIGLVFDVYDGTKNPTSDRRLNGFARRRTLCGSFPVHLAITVPHILRPSALLVTHRSPMLL
ncbi:lysophospholipid acyltransferase 5 [Rhipicephalus sanguineus]|uniref:lysophospholipid acyltransferase 5 n=1 Tax=Rhipicephalus sanguineus TaxID=34632 RepID=UPI0018963856|nr:lysophospholipid acyltransferase 5 [Rhipicephalus sanguineus]